MLLGKSLAVSHWAMAPFLWLLIYLPLQLAKGIGKGPWAWLLLLLIWSDPVLLGQAVLVSPDILVAAGFLSVVYGRKTGKQAWVLGGALLLCSASMRGMMTCAALGLWIALELFLEKAAWKTVWRSGLVFLPAGLAGIVFLVWHYTATGWMGHFEGSTWSAAFQRVDTRGFLKNIAVVGWRWTDFGRLAEWGLVLYWMLRSSRWGGKSWWLLVACLVLFLSPSALLYANLSAHRYFLPLFIAFHIGVWNALVEQDWTKSTKRWAGLGVSLILVLGNCWIYPKGISMDWDSTLAHRAYHPLREEALHYLDSLQVPFEEVGSAFPNLNTGEMLLLNGDQRSFSPLDLNENEWVFASNIFNDIDLPEYVILENQWDLLRHWERNGVWVQLYRRKPQAGK